MDFLADVAVCEHMNNISYVIIVITVDQSVKMFDIPSTFHRYLVSQLSGIVLHLSTLWQLRVLMIHFPERTPHVQVSLAKLHTEHVNPNALNLPHVINFLAHTFYELCYRITEHYLMAEDD